MFKTNYIISVIKQYIDFFSINLFYSKIKKFQFNKRIKTNTKFLFFKINKIIINQKDSGDLYEGEWLDDKKHGIGSMHFANGDVYEG